MYTDEIVCQKLERIEKLLEQIVQALEHTPRQIEVQTAKNSPVMVSTKQASELTGLSTAWFTQKRVARGGPPFIKAGGSVRYRVSDLHEWFDKNKVKHKQQPH